MRALILVSGLPASGKSTLGRALAAELQLPFFDKDVFLEQLFDLHGVDGMEGRQRLSRAADEQFLHALQATDAAIATSFWRHGDSAAPSGTPTAWLRDGHAHVLEVYCRCAPEVAARRFKDRQRHPGHCDALRAPTLDAQFERLAAVGPLGVGDLVEVDTGDDWDVVEAVVRVCAAWRRLSD